MHLTLNALACVQPKVLPLPNAIVGLMFSGRPARPAHSLDQGRPQLPSQYGGVSMTDEARPATMRQRTARRGRFGLLRLTFRSGRNPVAILPCAPVTRTPCS